MPSPQTVERFIARVEGGFHAEAIQEFYLEDGAIRENQAPPRVGRANLVDNERRVLARTRSVHTTCVRPYFLLGDLCVIRWIFRFETREGLTYTLEELAYQRWQGESIAEEQFFYDPAQFKPRPVEGPAPPGDG